MIPIIDHIVEDDGNYIALSSDARMLFVTPYKEIAEMYFNIPEIIYQQAQIIEKLRKHVDVLNAEHNSILAGMTNGASRLFN